MKRSLGPLAAADVVARAVSACGKGTRYRLGAGGRDPRLAHPAVAGACDCSGFAAWCVGVDRFLPNAGVPTMPGGNWFETTQLVRDAKSPFGFVTEVAMAQARPGDLLVYGDRGGRQGHVGVVVEVGEGGPVKVAHCAKGNELRGDAIAVTGVSVFAINGAVAARVAWVS